MDSVAGLRCFNQVTVPFNPAVDWARVHDDGVILKHVVAALVKAVGSVVVLGIKLFSLGFCPVVALVLNSEQHQDVQFWYFIVNVLDISAVLAEFFSVVPVFRT